MLLLLFPLSLSRSLIQNWGVYTIEINGMKTQLCTTDSLCPREAALCLYLALRRARERRVVFVQGSLHPTGARGALHHLWQYYLNYVLAVPSVCVF